MTNWEKLLGGYATGTLTAGEMAALMQAALRDQALFDVLMDEEALRETLADPATRAALLRALEPAEQPRAWWRNPWPWTGLGAVAAAVALVVILRPVDTPKPVQMAQNAPAAAAPEPVSVIIATPRQLTLSQPESKPKADIPSKQGSSRTDHARSARPLANARGSESGAEPRALASGRNRYFITDPKGPISARRFDPAVSAPTEERAEAPKMAMALPPPPTPPAAPAAQASEARGSAAARLNAPAAERPAETLVVSLFYQAADGVWRSLDLQSAVPANRPLRLRVTSAQSGLLAIQPPLAEARAVLAGIPNDVSLPGQPTGPFRLRLALVNPVGQPLGRLSNPLRASKSRAVADAAAPSAASSLNREIRLRIE